MSGHGKRAAPKKAARTKAGATSGAGGKDGKPGKPGKERSRRYRIVRGLLLGLVGFLVLGAGAFAYVYAAVDVPDPNEDFEAQTTFVYYADGKTEIGRFALQDRVSIPLADMPQ